MWIKAKALVRDLQNATYVGIEPFLRFPHMTSIDKQMDESLTNLHPTKDRQTESDA